VVYRGPYEYSRPDREEDHLPQWIEPNRAESTDKPSSDH
jgi:cytochrome c oxidase subunit 1